MSELDNNSELIWINTPFRLTQLDGQYPLIKQHILMSACIHLQKYIDDFFIEKHQLGDARSDNALVKGVEHVVMNIAPIKLELKDLKLVSGNMDYPMLRKVLLKDVLAMTVRYKNDNGVYVIQHIFSNVQIPTTKTGYTLGDKKFERLTGEVWLTIDPNFAMPLFDMTKGYIHHLAMIAKFSKSKNTPRFYLYLLRQIGLKNSMDVKVSYLDLKSNLGLVKIDENEEIIPDKAGQPTNNNYPKFSQFKKQVIEVVRADLNRMAAKNETDIVFDELQEDDIIYPVGKKKGNPKYIRFHVRRTQIGEQHNALDKNADIANKLNTRYKQNQVQKQVQPAEGDIFAHVYQSPEVRLQTEEGKGTDKWKSFVSLLKDDSQKSLVSRISFVGMKNKRFCIKCSDEDFEQLRACGVEKKAQEYFGCVGSFAPVFYRG